MPARADAGKPNRVISTPWEADYLEPMFIKDRRHPFEIIHPLHVESRVTLELPTPVASGTLASWGKRGDSDLCRWDLAASEKDGTVSIAFNSDGKTGSFPASRLPRGNRRGRLQFARSSSR